MGAEARQAHDRQIADAQRQVDAYNAHIDAMEAGLRENNRHAVRVVEPSPRPIARVRQIHHSVIAQAALRTLREIFEGMASYQGRDCCSGRRPPPLCSAWSGHW